MSSLIRRVPLDFDHPIGVDWPGFIMPENLPPMRCFLCDGDGRNAATKAISDSWSRGKRLRAWGGLRHNLDQADVDALIASDRLDVFLLDRVIRGLINPQIKKNIRFKEVNMWSRTTIGFCEIQRSRDFIIESRARRLGVYGSCPLCYGERHIYSNESHRLAHENWEDSEPPTGEGFQMWESIGDGSPVSPVFSDKADLARWIAAKFDMPLHHARGFVDRGYCMSGIIIGSGPVQDGLRYAGVDAAGS